MQYRIHITYSPEDEAYIARVPALPGCTADGETPEEAARELQVALQGHLEAREANQMSLPEDPILERLREVSALLNISELARESGISKSTLRSKLQRGSRFNPDEAARITHTLESRGLQLCE
ncbi:MAG: type II toxin-antitoxin system HicB family antitoxin [Coraliomargarita sp.]